MRTLLSLIAALVFAASGALAALAPKSVNKTWETRWFPPDRSGDAEAVAWIANGFEFSGNFKTWYLLGEPVINCTASWKISARTSVTIRAKGKNFIEPAQEGEVEVYNLMLAYAAPDPRGGEGSQIVVFCDAGVVAQNGRNGFNVAGSPSWDKFICALDRGYEDIRLRFADNDFCKAVGGNWLDTAAAKSVAQTGLDSRKVGLTDGTVKVLKVEISGMATMKRTEKRLWREKSARFKRERTGAYFANFPARSGEDAYAQVARKIDAMRRLPNLPEENPSAQQLKAYEAAWQDMLAENAFDGSLEKDWRAKEKKLVGEQLKRVKQRDRIATAEEDKYARYYARLQKLKENEPKNNDPMAEYRAATLIPFEVGIKTGLKRPDGSIAVAAQYFRGDPRQYIDGLGIYIADSKPYYVGNSRYDDGPCGSTRCVIYYDNDGRILYKKPGEIADNEFQCRDEHYGKILIKFGLICERINIDYEHSYSGDALIYSFVEQRKIIPNTRQAFPGSFYRVQTSAYPIIRNGRMALALTAHIYPSYTESPYDRFTYFYLDDESYEGSITSTPYYADPLNTKIE